MSMDPAKQATRRKPHPADGMTAKVDCGDGACMSVMDPRSFARGGPAWVMRYGDPGSIRFAVASLLESYDHLLCGDISQAEAIRRLRLMRAKRRECISNAE